ncbi:hypothetical protein GVN16_06770 [Emticicia sp. CRIBPO]|jgi:hypothetical protein|uniref:FtsL-like putative cell division protein n=1 Tax=Emticicia sp. CRIBPO TaxID=2683258 RepID=UPI00141268B9|nr:FtsL-like putative cell division protein [Emticicia sp. CRIBPO]NBA85457.1 hypothetical protein [Emticicia sp. CRIBPO]
MSFNRPRRPAKQPVRLFGNLNLLSRLTDWINTKIDIGDELPTKTIRKLIWCICLAIIYIYFQHNYETQIRNLGKTEKEMNEKRAEYITYKSKYMFSSKQSEIEKKLADQGLEKNILPPLKIVVSEEK